MIHENIEKESNKLFEKKQALEKMYNDSVDFYCRRDEKNINVIQ